MTPPSYPLRPVNGGPLPLARPKRGRWTWEPKVNGWRAWINTAAGQTFNRKNEPLSIEREFAPILAKIKAANLPIIWLDTEAFERRHPLGRGSLVLLDFAPGVYPGGYTLPLNMTREQRQIFMDEATNGLAVPGVSCTNPRLKTASCISPTPLPITASRPPLTPIGSRRRAITKAKTMTASTPAGAGCRKSTKLSAWSSSRASSPSARTVRIRSSSAPRTRNSPSG